MKATLFWTSLTAVVVVADADDAVPFEATVSLREICSGGSGSGGVGVGVALVTTRGADGSSADLGGGEEGELLEVAVEWCEDEEGVDSRGEGR
jgi:hypothetical protein